MKKRIFTMFLTALLCMTGGEMVCQAKRPLSSYSTQSYNWGLGQNLNHKKPNGTGPAGWKCKKDHAYYIGKCSKKNKVVYLSFDCGYEAGYTKKILKTLKKHHAKAIFFVTKDYIMSSPGLVKKMKKEGHLVGNHTTHHPRMAKLSVKRIQREIKECEKAMKRILVLKWILLSVHRRETLACGVLRWQKQWDIRRFSGVWPTMITTQQTSRERIL